MKTKVELLEEIVEKQDELIDLLEREIGMLYDISRVRRNKANYTNVTLLGQELASLKSQLAEAGEEKVEDVYTKSLRLLTEFMDKTPSEEIAVELRKIAEKAGEEKKDYSHLCCICHENYVDSDNGYDTCDSCMNRVTE